MSSDYGKCEKCNQYDWLTNHSCKPFKVYCPEYYGDEWETVYGNSSEHVAEIIAELLNQEDPIFEENIFESPIIVRDAYGVETAYKCHANISIDYYAEEILEGSDE